ncbi:MAG: DUF4345 family protein [Pseudomonadota bacterium]
MVELTIPDQWPEFMAWLTAVATVLIGIVIMVAPVPMMAWLGLAPTRADGISEVRGPFGGVWVGLGLACVLLAQPFTYFALGLAFLVAVLGRLLSFVVDRSLTIHCAVATIFEALSAYFPLRFAADALGLM